MINDENYDNEWHIDDNVEERVRRHDVPTKPDTFRIIDEIKLFLVSYPNILAVEIVSILGFIFSAASL